MTESHSLSAQGLSLSYGDRTIVEGLDLVIPPAASPRSWEPTDAASPPSCVRSRVSSRRVRAR